MRPTIGLVNELYYIAKVFNKEMSADCKSDDNYSVKLRISPNGILNVYYEDSSKYELIWNEEIVSDSSNFGIESLDSISRIITCLQNNSPDWQKYVYREDLFNNKTKNFKS